ncbi:class I SAM-dependent methyltransferase [Cytobacillus sp.]|uniref:class I SAM-dependent methyltransferase n=1 Tax=Cytobacillus sp. TaxID=2675269 RepID=UPI0028BDB0E3|nr:class I SAM-dependent methyltransferase [Cytobacillus sp.]
MQQSESLTSLVSAFGRAYHSQFDTPRIFDDFLAKELITEDEFLDIKKNMIQGIQFFNKDIAERFKDNPDEVLKWITQVQLSPTPLARAAYCESVLLNEIELGVKQYVILGAGLDTFSFRYPELSSSLNIFEVDHPITQKFKKKRIADAQLEIPNNLHFVPMDFTKEFSNAVLAEAGCKLEKTFFSLLGVTYYLTKKEIKDLIGNLFNQLPSGSSIVFDYADEHLLHESGLSNRVKNMVAMAAVGGEPMKSCFSYSEMESLLEDVGLLIYEHLTPMEIDDRYFCNREDYLSAFETIHYIHAVKR